MQLRKKIKFVFLILTLFVSSLQTSLAAIANCSELSNMNHTNMMQSMQRASHYSISSIDQKSILTPSHEQHTANSPVSPLAQSNLDVTFQTESGILPNLLEQDQNDCCSTENTECASMHCPSAVVMALTVVDSSTITYISSNVIINPNKSFFTYANFSIYRPPII